MKWGKHHSTVWVSFILAISLILSSSIALADNDDEGFGNTPLRFSDLTNIDLSGLTYGQGTSCGDVNYVAFTFYNASGNYPYGERKGVNKDGCGYQDGSEGVNNRIKLALLAPWGSNIVAGDYVTITYDGDKMLDVYLPEVNQAYNPGLNLYIAENGSTYYDEALTNLAQAAPDEVDDSDGDGFTEDQGDCDDNDPDIYPGAPELCDGKDNQCPGDPGYGVVDEGCDPGNTPLRFSDLTNIDLSGLTYGQGTSCGDVNYVAFTFYNASGNYPYGERKGVNKDGCGYQDGSEGVNNRIKLALLAPWGSNIVAGDYVTITYDGDKMLKVYLPEVNQAYNPGLNLYIAENGSTYYDEALTNLAQAAPDEVDDSDGDGFTEDQGDCDDNDPDIYPGAPELCDGKDNQCPGDPGYGVVDEGCDPGNTPLRFSDLTNIDLSGLTYGQGTSCGDVNYVAFTFYNASGNYPYGERKGVNKDGCGYQDGSEGVNNRIKLALLAPWGSNIVAGDYVTITYDGDKMLDVYLPEVNQAYNPGLNLYIAENGSTYYDEALTNLAYPAPDEVDDSDGDGFTEDQGDCDDNDPDIYPGAPELCDGKDNQCPGDPGYGVVDEGCDPGNTPLRFSDLTNIDLSGLTYGQGTSCGDVNYVAFTFYNASGNYPYGERKGVNKDGCGYQDGSEGVNNRIKLALLAPWGSNIVAGDYVTITYDGDKMLDVYLPKIDQAYNPGLNLYIAENGSTYYDEALTNLAQAANPEVNRLELIIGLSNGKGYVHENTGDNSSSIWTHQPSWNLPDVGAYSNPAFADLDGDGDPDAIVGDNTGIGEAYENKGSPDAPSWERNSDWDVPDCGSYSAPALADLDCDGDPDALVGNSVGKMLAYRNTGGISLPVWTRETSWDLPEDVGSYADPVLVDMDDDGDMDLLVGENKVGVVAYENIGGCSIPVWERRSDWDAAPIASRFRTTVAAGDLDRDNDIDLMLGNNRGEVLGFENTGSAGAPIWTRQAAWDGNDLGSYSAPALVPLYVKSPPPPEGLIVTPEDGMSCSGKEPGPFNPECITYTLENTSDDSLNWMATKSEDWLSIDPVEGTLDPGGTVIVLLCINDTAKGLAPGAYTDEVIFTNETTGIGDTTREILLRVLPEGKEKPDLLIGLSDGKGYAYENAGDGTSPIWTRQSGRDLPDVGAYSNVAFDDLDGDGDWDAIAGDSTGVGEAYENTGDNETPAWTRKADWDLPDVGSYAAPTLGDLNDDDKPDALIGNSVGRVSAFINTGSVSSPTWTPEPDWDLSDDVGGYADPVLVDMDEDGNLDLLIGEANTGVIAYWNSGSVISPVWTRAPEWDGPKAGYRTTVVAGDLDGDNDIDLILGGKLGQVLGYENTDTSMTPVWVPQPAWDAEDLGSYSAPALVGR